MSLCKACGTEVQWRQEHGRKQCYNLDGSIHWDLCSRLKWQQVKATGERFVNEKIAPGERADGYRNSIHGTKKSRHAYAPVGTVQLSSDCKRCVPPWEICGTCPDRLERAVWNRNEPAGTPA